MLATTSLTLLTLLLLLLRQHRGAGIVRPLAKHALQVARDTLEDDGGDGDEGAVLHAGGQDGVFLGKVEGVAEGRVLGLGVAADEDVHFEEGVEDVDVGRAQVGLAEGGEFDNLGRLASTMNRQRDTVKMKKSKEKKSMGMRKY